MNGQPLALVTGHDGPAVVLSGRVAAWLLERTNLPVARTAARGEDRALDEALTVLTVAGMAHRARVERATSPGASATTSATTSPEEVRPIWTTTEDAAARLGITPRAVRLQIAAGRIPARRDGRRWLVDPDRAGHYRQESA